MQVAPASVQVHGAAAPGAVAAVGAGDLGRFRLGALADHATRGRRAGHQDGRCQVQASRAAAAVAAHQRWARLAWTAVVAAPHALPGTCRADAFFKSWNCWLTRVWGGLQFLWRRADLIVTGITLSVLFIKIMFSFFFLEIELKIKKSCIASKSGIKICHKDAFLFLTYDSNIKSLIIHS